MSPDDLVEQLRQHELETQRRVRGALRDAGDALAVQAGAAALGTTPRAGRTDARVVDAGDTVSVRLRGPGRAPGIDVAGLERVVGQKVEEAGR